MITYLDRACIATLAPGIVRDLGLSTVQMGYVFTVFQLAYALFEIPTAWWADRKGTRSVLSRIVLWWSFLTAATGAAFSYPVLLAIRFLFGMGEAGAWPCVARTFSRWIPARERGRVQGIFFAGRASGRRPDAGSSPLAAPVPLVARDLRLLRGGWSRVDGDLAYLVPQRSIGAFRGECRRTADDRVGASGRLRPRGRTGILAQAASPTET